MGESAAGDSKEKEKEKDSVVTKIQGMMRGAVARKYHKDALPHLIRYVLQYSVV